MCNISIHKVRSRLRTITPIALLSTRVSKENMLVRPRGKLYRSKRWHAVRTRSPHTYWTTRCRQCLINEAFFFLTTPIWWELCAQLVWWTIPQSTQKELIKDCVYSKALSKQRILMRLLNFLISKKKLY